MLLPEENKLLLNQLRNNDEGAFRMLYLKYHQAVFANISRLVPQHEAAEDILQEVFIALWENRNKLSDSHQLAGWLFTTSYYKSCAWLKKAVREKIVLPDNLHEIAEEQIDQESLITERLSVIHTAVEKLPPQKRKAFQLCRMEGKTYEEAAEILGVSIQSVKDYVKSSSQIIRKQVLSGNAAMAPVSIILLTAYLQA